MKEEIKNIFESLQLLDMKPTPQNVSIMDGVYRVLRKIYQELEEEQKTEMKTQNE